MNHLKAQAQGSLGAIMWFKLKRETNNQTSRAKWMDIVTFNQRSD